VPAPPSDSAVLRQQELAQAYLTATAESLANNLAIRTSASQRAAAKAHADPAKAALAAKRADPHLSDVQFTAKRRKLQQNQKRAAAQQQQQQNQKHAAAQQQQQRQHAAQQQQQQRAAQQQQQQQQQRAAQQRRAAQQQQQRLLASSYHTETAPPAATSVRMAQSEMDYYERLGVVEDSAARRRGDHSHPRMRSESPNPPPGGRALSSSASAR
jgi:hypothetical protein